MKIDIKWIRALWIAAAVMALINVGVNIRRIPVIRMQQRTPEEISAEGAAQRLSSAPRWERVLLLLSHRDITSLWFHYRLGYFLYPRRHDVAWDTLPPDAAAHYDYILTFGSARDTAPQAWQTAGRWPMATLKQPSGADALASVPAAREPDWRSWAAALAALAVVPALGALLLATFAPSLPLRGPAARLAVAHFVGAGALTWVSTLTALLAGRLMLWPGYALLLCLLPASGRAWRWLRGRYPAGAVPAFEAVDDNAPTPRRDDRLPAGTRRLWLGLLVAIIALGVASAVQRGVLLGLDWDGYAIWQLKARAFFQDGDLRMLRDPAHFAYAHLDYPLLVPIQTWWLYSHFGADSDRWAQLIGFLFYVDLLVVFWAAARQHLSRTQAALGLAILAGLPELTQHAVSGFADLPLALGLLVVASLLVGELGTGVRVPALPWVLAATALVKNEGLAVGMAVVITLGVMSRSRASERSGDAWRSILIDIGAIAAAHAPWLIVKRLWRLRNDLLEERLHAVRESPLWRLGVIVVSYVGEMCRVGPRLPAWGLLTLLYPVGLACTLRRQVRTAHPAWLLAGFQLLLYTGIYLITPLEVRGHLASSVDRLMLHLVPTLLLASLLGCFAPGLARPTQAE